MRALCLVVLAAATAGAVAYLEVTRWRRIRAISKAARIEQQVVAAARMWATTKKGEVLTQQAWHEIYRIRDNDRGTK